MSLTDAGIFFAQPAIVREEALFQGIDRALAMMPSAFVSSSSIKRANIRQFSEGKNTAVDLGLLQLKKNAEKVTLSPVLKENAFGAFPARHFSELGFSLLIKQPGLYTLKGMVIDVAEGTGLEEGGSSFFAVLPLVMRPCTKEDRVGRCRAGKQHVLTAVDRFGSAAFIDGSGLSLGRNEKPALQRADVGRLCVVKVTQDCGGVNV
ncbi:MAG: hypothetical protein LBG94_08615 [Treponema sp.]|nr:hypothetical protein [Treponema sp.]